MDTLFAHGRRFDTPIVVTTVVKRFKLARRKPRLTAEPRVSGFMTKATYESMGYRSIGFRRIGAGQQETQWSYRLLAACAAADATAERQQLMTVPSEQPRRIPMKSPGGIAPGNHQRGDLDSDATRIAPIADQPADLDGLLAPHGVGGPHVREVALARPARPATTDGTDGADDGAGGTHPTGGGAPLHRQHLCPQRVTKWVLGWERRLEGRRQAAGEERHRVEWFWVKGHAGVYGPAEHRSRCHLSSVIGVLLRCDTIFSG